MKGIHKEGRIILAVTTPLIMILSIIVFLILPLPLSLPLIILPGVVLLLVFRFFRIPEREFIARPGVVLAPADGTVVAIESVTESEYYDQKRKLVSIFMSIHNVHINWYPVSGEIKYFKYHPGKYLLARHPKSSELNERTTIVIGDEKNDLLLRQIAGYVARRIICYASPGMRVTQAQEIGFIRFGSRVDLYLPEDTEVFVKLGDHTKGGITEIARFK